MRADCILRRILNGVIEEVHHARVNAVHAAGLALILGGEVGLASLGRSLATGAHKHGIKRADRLLGNPHLAIELDTFYAAITRHVVSGNLRPVILVDWTDAGDEMCTLTAAVPVKGRAITIYSVTVPKKMYTAAAVDAAFLATLKALLGPTCKPILVGDAGFRVPWMKRVRAIGWDFVTRIRGKTLVQPVVGDGCWQHWKGLCSKARPMPRSLGSYRVVRHQGIDVQLIVVDKRSRRARSGTARPRNLRALRAAKSQREPWCLATSLALPAKQVAALYTARMQIELTFRDLKSHRFGWGFEDARCRSTSRVAIQIMLAALASLVCMLVGLAAETAGLHKRFQANTTTNRRVLSLVTLGRAVIGELGKLLELRLSELALPTPFEGIR